MYQNCCKKCGSTSFHTEIKGNNTGLYCDDCGSWITWLGKNELRAFEHSKKENNENMPLSPEDAIRRSSYCLALERDRNAILNILGGKDFSYVGD